MYYRSRGNETKKKTNKANNRIKSLGQKALAVCDEMKHKCVHDKPSDFEPISFKHLESCIPDQHR